VPHPYNKQEKKQFPPLLRTMFFKNTIPQRKEMQIRN